MTGTRWFGTRETGHELDAIYLGKNPVREGNEMKTALKIIWLGMMMLANAAAHADEVVGLKTFTSGTRALASEVNGNFDAVKNAVDDNHVRVSVLENADAATRIAALEAQIAALAQCPPNTAARFTDDGDGTICDSQTGLMWEKKEDCGGVIDLANPHCVAIRYTWSDLPLIVEPSGTL